MKKKSIFKKTLTTLVLTLSALPILTGKPLITELAPVPETIISKQDTGEGTEPGIQPLNDRDCKCKKEN